MSIHPLARLIALALSVCTAQAQLVRQAGTINLPADLPAATGYATTNAFPGLSFSNPMATATVPGETNRLFVAERGGNLQCVSGLSTTPTKTAYLALSSLLLAGETLRSDNENGFLSVAFHPNFSTNGTLFVYFSMQSGGQLHQRLHQVTVSNPTGNTASIAQHKPLLTIVDRFGNHNGGSLGFGADGFLYLSLGDEGDGNDSQNNARFINTQLDPVGTTNRVMRTGFWGQMLRLAVEVNPVAQPGVFPAGSVGPNAQAQNSTSFPSAIHGNYRVPADNPFHDFTTWHNVAIDPLSVRTEIYATGLRNPFRWNFDPPTGRLFLGDVGQGTYEEIDLIVKGGDYGWSWREGLHAFSNPPSPTTPPGIGFTPINPIYEYDHTNNGNGNDAVITGTAVMGGLVYRGGALSELYGKYLFCDQGTTGHIVALTENGSSWSGVRLAADSGLVHFGINPATGEMIMCDLGEGVLKRLTRSGTTGSAPPDTLSATGVFSNLANLTPSTGVVPYAPNVAFWSDYAIKSRWFTIENLSDTVGYSANGNWTLPTGMIWVKHFDIETTRGVPATRRKLETRFLVKTATDIYGITYKWRDNQTEADLVGENGLTELISGSSPAQTWRYPSRTECKACHTPVGGYALSFNTRQLNRDGLFGAQTLNQLTALSNAGYFSTAVTGVHNLPALVPAGDTTASLESRVRSYLAVNCVQCHQPGGTATGNWDARITTATDAASLINGTLANTAGDPLNRWAVPNDPGHSMVLKRLQGAGVPRMPPLGTLERDLAAETLLTDWITALATRQSFTQWQAAQFNTVGGPGSPSAQPDADPDFDGQTNRFEYLLSHPPLVLDQPIVPASSITGNTITLTFEQPANRSALIETSLDLLNWSLWDAPGNAPTFPATPQTRTLTAPLDQLKRVFRLRLSEQ